MSRVGRLPVAVPSGVSVEIEPGHVSVKGPRGELQQDLHRDLHVALDDGEIVVTRPSDRREHRSQHGLARSLIQNMVTGVSEGWTKTLEIQGTGYRAEMDGKTLVLRVGFSHLVYKEPPDGIEFAVEGQLVHVRGANKQVVGQQAAEIRAVRPPEPYKGKGIRYQGEWVRRKQGKSAIG
ncbi:MAG: 50S ribosomal protein L6 [Chloroflexi bacterium]|nr:50S ribosomal protein L6 [Chloroflexota bacterium]MXX80216.1 50S ribosomal protein L6 [Chloroflexota bacterium]MYB21238.1 50S ribosomal protein L6 [Chloroflexota bacterium]MYD16156.1 50S ribosomal protein L6 [Chloroflexota bacterium]MYF23319.1 50S ribosomal protein L6 [Chloroflexota bacterium]